MPYKYIVSRDETIYKEYCEYNKRTWKNEQMSKQRFDNLIDSLEREGNTNKKNIVVVDDNIIWDGQHRCCWLLSKYGEGHVINVLHCKRFHPESLFLFKILYKILRHII